MREDKARDLIVLILFRRGKTIKYPLQKIKLAKTPLQVKINGHQCNFTIIIWTKKNQVFTCFTPTAHQTTTPNSEGFRRKSTAAGMAIGEAGMEAIKQTMRAIRKRHLLEEGAHAPAIIALQKPYASQVHRNRISVYLRRRSYQ